VRVPELFVQGASGHGSAKAKSKLYRRVTVPIAFRRHARVQTHVREAAA
jgi:hypothetical protein